MPRAASVSVGTWRLTIAATLVALAFFGVARAAGVAPGENFDGNGASLSVALVGILLLAIDAVVPVPATAVMAALGAAFGTLIGAGVSTLGLIASAGLSYSLGRSANRFYPMHASPAASRPRDVVAVGATRGLPIVAEAVAFSAGVIRMPPAIFVLATTMGAAPVAVMCAASGDLLDASVVAVLAVLFVIGAIVAPTVGYGRNAAPSSKRPRAG